MGVNTDICLNCGEFVSKLVAEILVDQIIEINVALFRVVSFPRGYFPIE